MSDTGFNQVTVTILGKSYTIAPERDHSVEYIREIAQLADEVAVMGEHADLMGLGAPVNAHKPLGQRCVVWVLAVLVFWVKIPHRLSPLFGVSRGIRSALYWRSQRNFLPDVYHGGLAGVRVPQRRSWRRADGALPAR